MSSPKIYIIRHGQTDWNAQNIIQGRANTPLNDFGRTQAKRNGNVLARELSNPAQFQFVSSPLDRARETMEIIRQELDLPSQGYQTDDRLLEVNYGGWQEHSWVELRKAKSKEIEARFADLWGTVAPGGESYEQATIRITDWLDNIKDNTIVVTHGGTMRCIRGHIIDEDKSIRPKFDVPHDKILLLEDDELFWI